MAISNQWQKEAGARLQGSRPLDLSKVQAPQAFLPSSEDGLPDEFSKSLFRASSEVPDGMANVGRTKDALDIPEGARLFAYNADPTALLQLLTLASSAPVGKE